MNTTKLGLELLLIQEHSTHKNILEEKSIHKIINGHVKQRSSLILKLILDKWYFQELRFKELINSKIWIWANMEMQFKVQELFSKMDSLISCQKANSCTQEWQIRVIILQAMMLLVILELNGKSCKT